MFDSKSNCREQSLVKPCSKSTTFVPVIGDVICEGPGVIYVSIDPDVWRIRCQQCQKKMAHKCPLKKLSRKFKKNADKRQKLDSEDERETELRLKGAGLLGEDELEENENEEEDLSKDMCHCPDRPGTKKPKPKVCLCNPYKPVNFLLEVNVTGEQKAEFKPKKKKRDPSR